MLTVVLSAVATMFGVYVASHIKQCQECGQTIHESVDEKVKESLVEEESRVRLTSPHANANTNANANANTNTNTNANANTNLTHRPLYQHFK